MELRFLFILAIFFVCNCTPRQYYHPSRIIQNANRKSFTGSDPNGNERGPGSVVQATSASTPEDNNEKMSFTQAVILAKAEAQCIDAFGSQENRTVPATSSTWIPAEKILRPFGCFTRETHAQCKQCQLRLIPRSSEECATFCNASDTTQVDLDHVDLCNKTCFHSSTELTNSSQEFQERLNENDGIGTTTDIPTGVTNEANDNTSSTETSTEKSVQPNEPIHEKKNDRVRVFRDAGVFCEGVYTQESSQPNKHIAVLRWNVGPERIRSQADSPLVYVIQEKKANASEWTTIGKTSSGLYAVNVSYYSSTYRWRITAVSPRGIEDAVETDEYITLNGYQKPSQPKQIYVAATEVRNSQLNVLISWIPPPEKTCYYKIVLDGTTGTKSKTVRTYEPIGVNSYWFSNLSFSKPYHVLMTSRDRAWRYESTSTFFEFTTPTCLESFGYRFDKCAPPRVSHHEIGHTILKTETNKPLLKAELRWKPPPNTSESNPILGYLVELTPFYLNFTGRPNFTISRKDFDATINYTVPGNVTKLFLNLKKDVDYTVVITAYSIRGGSPPTQYRLSTKLLFTAHLTNNVSDEYWTYVYASISFGSVVVLLIGYNVFRFYWRKRKEKRARDEYFQNIEARDASAPDCPIVPLTDDSLDWKIFDEGFPRDKWEICWDDLSMKEIIGQGAFGVVRRALIEKKKLEQKLRFRGEGESWIHSPDRSTDKHDPAKENVAVKMVKVSSTRDDREHLIKEITMMQNVGFHPQIVSLLGACTKGKMLCLVLEYCQGGDLLSFIRKVRAKYWPTLGLVVDQNSPLSDPNCRNSMIKAAGMQMMSEASIESDSPITYADVGFASDGEIYCPGSAQDEMAPGQCSTNIAATNAGMCSNSDGDSLPSLIPEPNPRPEDGNNDDDNDDDDDDNENFHPIDEKDVLSYARQIAMAMEYLEKNRIVHRDLACRNILLMSDFKHIKISDFGLSRDVYTWNVYQQKSNGKVPIKWMAIESLFTNTFTTKSDVWSYGILLWELITLGGSPYPGMGNVELFEHLRTGHRLSRPENCSQELYALMEKCWRAFPGHRPSFSELRRYIETMMEAAEPNLYLSLQADIPKDFYELNNSDDLNLTSPEPPPRSLRTQPVPGPSRSTGGLHKGKYRNAAKIHGDTGTGEEDSSKALLDQSPNNFEESVTLTYSNCTFLKNSPVEKEPPQNVIYEDIENAQEEQELLDGRPLTPDSGILAHQNPPEAIDEEETGNEDSNSQSHGGKSCLLKTSATVHPRPGPVQSQGSGSPPHQGKGPAKLTLPFVRVNDMTIIENRSYGLFDS